MARKMDPRKIRQLREEDARAAQQGQPPGNAEDDLDIDFHDGSRGPQAHPPAQQPPPPPPGQHYGTAPSPEEPQPRTEYVPVPVAMPQQGGFLQGIATGMGVPLGCCIGCIALPIILAVLVGVMSALSPTPSPEPLEPPHSQQYQPPARQAPASSGTYTPPARQAPASSGTYTPPAPPTAPSPAASAPSAPSGSASFHISQFIWRPNLNQYLSTIEYHGMVTNRGNRAAEFVKIYTSFYDASGRLLTTDTTYAEAPNDILQPGQTVQFSSMTEYVQGVASAKAYAGE